MAYRILCVSDGREQAKRAVAYASDLAKLTIAAVNVAMGGMREQPVLYAWMSRKPSGC